MVPERYTPIRPIAARKSYVISGMIGAVLVQWKCMNTARKPYPSDISDEEWSLIIPYLLLMKEDAEQRHHDLGELFDGLRYVIRYGITWRTMPNDLPPWTRCISTLGAGWKRAVSRLLSTIFWPYTSPRQTGTTGQNAGLQGK